MAIDEVTVTATLGKIPDPIADGKSIVEAERVAEFRIRQGDVRVELVCPNFSREQRFELEDTVADALEAAGAADVEVLVSSAGTFAKAASGGGVAAGSSAPTSAVSPLGGQAKPVPPSMIAGVRSAIAVASAKGGVGKSSIAVNLAIALEKLGNTVGLLDVDIYGPSTSVLMGVEARPSVDEQGRISPVERHGVQMMSLSFFAEPGEPVIWRGPMVGKLIKQFIGDVNWGERDYMIIDLPPGTGDAQLSLVQETKVTGAVLVTTPSELALLDARRGQEMFAQVDVPVLGIIENMSYYVCPSCDKRHEIFDHGGGRKAADETGVHFLGELPLDTVVRAEGDAGRPVAVRGPDDLHAAPYYRLAREVIAAVAAQNGETAPPDDNGAGASGGGKRKLFNITRG